MVFTVETWESPQKAHSLLEQLSAEVPQSISLVLREAECQHPHPTAGVAATRPDELSIVPQIHPCCNQIEPELTRILAQVCLFHVCQMEELGIVV